MKANRFAIVCTALALTACNSEAKKETGGTAGGEILPASVSDSMLPFDTVRSQAPLTPKAEGGEASKDKKDPKPEARREAKTAEPEEPAE